MISFLFAPFLLSLPMGLALFNVHVVQDDRYQCPRRSPARLSHVAEVWSETNHASEREASIMGLAGLLLDCNTQIYR